MRPVLFFDSDCHLCERSIVLLLKIDHRGALYYAGLNSPLAKREIPALTDVDSVVFFCQRGAFIKSDAVVEIFRELGGTYTIVAKILGMIPSHLRNWFYDFVARNRYKVFGHATNCIIPTEEQKKRFLHD